MSGLGKGVTASSIGLILKACGLRVTSIKIGIVVLLCSSCPFEHFHSRSVFFFEVLLGLDALFFFSFFFWYFCSGGVGRLRRKGKM